MLQGIDIKEMLAGASLMDEGNRTTVVHAILRYLACVFPGVVDHWNAFMSPNQEIIGSVSIPDWKGSVVCSIPRRVALLTNNPMRPLRCHVSHQAEIGDLGLSKVKQHTLVEIPFKPARVLLQDFTGVPVVVDLACMCDAMNKLGSDSNKINPLEQGEICFSEMGVNLEYLGRVVFNSDGMLYPDSVVGTDSHTTIIDGLGVAGWGVGCIEAEAVMLGQEKVAMIEAYLRANNMFVDYNERNLISTPPTSGTILPGITRKTVIDIARDHGFQD
ncbi:unnamed protein product [Camellia sinensis]